MSNIILMTFTQLYETYIPSQLEDESNDDYLKRLNKLKSQFKRDLALAYNVDGEIVNKIYDKWKFWGLVRIREEIKKNTKGHCKCLITH